MKILSKARAIRDAVAERKRLRGPAQLEYAIADRLAMLDAGAWNVLTADAGFFMSHAYLTALEAVLPDNLAPRYALIFDGAQKPVAAVYMQLADIGVAQVRPKKAVAAERPPLAALDKLAARMSQRVLTCGNLLCYGQHGVAFAPGVDPETAWHGVAEVLYRVRTADKLRGTTHFVLIKDIHGPHKQNSSGLSNLSYRYVETEPNMVLALDAAWKNHDDYLASLASKYRSGIRNSVLKPIDEAGCTIEAVSDAGVLQSRIHELYQAVQSNADFRPYELGPDYFPALQRVAGERLRFSVLKRNEAVLGFLITLADGDTAIAYHIGFDREAASGLPIYLRLLHVGISDGIALGCKRVSFGRTALEPKAALGAKPETFGVLLRHRQPVLNKLIKRLLTGIEHDDAPDRNPFKKAANAG
ncbi:MAG: GNAT family N-acetyltransferase [Luteolibacter sp.]|uniref:GNAT family N-acetyltransferase n=1 Tax=Luteolibacter sp. TaxID=1962973 RepID=UPI003267E225